MSASHLGAPYVLEESSNDSVRPVGYISECRVNDPPADCWNPLIERYINGECAIDLSIREGPFRDADQLPTPHYRILLYWPGFHTFNRVVGEGTRGFWKGELVLFDQRPRELDGTMLVSIREFVEMPERAFPTLPCAAVCYRERLFGVDHLDVVRVDPWKEPAHPFLHEMTPRHIDRELNSGWRELAVLPSIQLVDKVIETAPEIVNDLTNPHAPRWIGFAPDIYPDQELFRLSVELNPWFIRVAVEEGRELWLESVNLAPGPVAL